MLLTDKNGLCKMIHRDIDKDAKVYLDGGKVSIYTTFCDSNYIRLKVADYVGNRMLHDSYKSLMIVNE